MLNKILSAVAICVGISLAGLPTVSAENLKKKTEQKKSPSQEEVVQDSITVTSEYIEIDAINSTKNLRVITREDIQQKGYETISDVLSDVPTINVDKGGYGDIDIRGQGSETASRNLQIMVDGAPIGILTQHPYRTDYNIIPVDQIEKIEIIEGGGAVLYGSGTAGGVINITTGLKGMKDPKSSVGLEYETDNKYRFFGNTGVKIKDRAVIQANYSGERSDLYFKNTYKYSDYFGLGGALKIGDRQHFSIKYSHYEEEGDYVFNVNKEQLEKYGEDYVPGDYSPIIGYDENTGTLIYGEKRPRYNQSRRESDGLKAAYSLNFMDNFTLMADLVSQKGSYRNSHYEDKDMDYDNYGIKTKLNWKYLPEHHLLLGVDWVTQNATLTYPAYSKQTNYYFDYGKQTKAVYLHNKNRIGDFEFTQGVRYDVSDWTTTKPLGSGSKYAGTSNTIDNQRINQAYELSSAWLYSESGRIFARYERGFTLPDGLQMTDAVYVDASTKRYQATRAEDEIYDTYEIGFRDYFWHSFVHATAYLTTTGNQLNRVYITSDLGGAWWKQDYKTLNILETKRYGFDIGAEQKFGKLRLTQSYAWSMGKSNYTDKGLALLDEGKQLDWSDSGLVKVPEHKVVLGVDYDFTRKFTAGLKYKYTGEYYNTFDEADTEEDSLVDGYSLVDFRCRYDFQNGLVIHGGINNLFDETYYRYVPAGSSKTVWPAFGRTYFVGMSFIF